MQPSALFSLESRIALVTGGGGALGRHIALALAEAGATVVLAGRTLGTLEETAAAVTAAGGTAHCIRMDVTEESSIAEALAQVHGEIGLIDIVLNNAGANRPKLAVDVSAADWDAVLDTNLRGCFLVAQHCARQLIKASAPGSIVNIASVLALRGQKGVSAYMAAKAGLVHLTHSLALEWARYSIRVNALLPGYVRSELTEAFLASDEGLRIKRNIPQRRLADAAELTGPLLLLASNAGSYMTGATLVVDGGLVVTSL